MKLNRSTLLALGGAAILCLIPTAAAAVGQEFYVTVASRIIIMAIAASSLNLLIGYCGLISFGHAAFLGLGAYTVGILMSHGVDSAWLSWPAAVLVAGLAALVIGWFSLRTQGVYFIMITLAFAQMLFYVFISLKAYGGDDGLPLAGKSKLGFVDIGPDDHFYYVVLFVFFLVHVVLFKIIDSRFGRVIRAVKTNIVRTEAVGYPVQRYRLVCFTIAGAICGLAGALLANQTGLVSPTLLHWSQSGQLMVMVIFGGVGYRYGGVAGAAVLLVLEEVLSAYTIYWPLGVGLILLIVVLAEGGGVAALVQRMASWKRKDLREPSSKEFGIDSAA